MIIIGYQGIGKSTLAGKNNCIDLESGNFWVDGKRADDWYIPYCQIANHLSEQGYTVFVSSHEVVRNELKKSKEKVFVVCPSTWLQDKWIKKLSDRYETTGLIKDFKAWKNAEERYADNIMELMGSGLEFYNIKDMDYDLKDIVNYLGGLSND
jgi:dimeric dUTPase (all-alpha-NTP-PPase superfamily)